MRKPTAREAMTFGMALALMKDASVSLACFGRGEEAEHAGIAIPEEYERFGPLLAAAHEFWRVGKDLAEAGAFDHGAGGGPQ